MDDVGEKICDLVDERDRDEAFLSDDGTGIRFLGERSVKVLAILLSSAKIHIEYGTKWVQLVGYSGVDLNKALSWALPILRTALNLPSDRVEVADNLRRIADGEDPVGIGMPSKETVLREAADMLVSEIAEDPFRPNPVCGFCQKTLRESMESRRCSSASGGSFSMCSFCIAKLAIPEMKFYEQRIRQLSSELDDLRKRTEAK